jgi:hypothetical protein
VDNDLYALLSGMQTSLARVEQKQDDMRKELFGNGQPGRLAKLELKLDRVDEDVIEHTRQISNARTWAAGAIATIVALAGGVEWLRHYFNW